MNQYERLLQLAHKDDVEVIDYRFESNAIKGLYCNNTIALNKRLETTAEKACVLAEELGHHYTSAGDIIDQKNIVNKKQEHRARLWGYKQMVTLEKIVSAYKAGCRNRYEVADHIGVSEDFLQNALDKYGAIYGAGVQVKEYLILFAPLRIYHIDY